MKTLHEVEHECTELIATLTSIKDGIHSWKNSREDSQEAIDAKEVPDGFLDWIRQEVIKVRNELSKLIGR